MWIGRSIDRKVSTPRDAGPAAFQGRSLQGMFTGNGSSSKVTVFATGNAINAVMYNTMCTVYRQGRIWRGGYRGIF